MDLLRIFLYMLLVPFPVVVLAVVVGAFGGQFLPKGKRLVHSIGTVALVLPAATISYTLFVDWGALVWVGVAFLFLVPAALLLIFSELRTAGISRADALSQVREIWKRVKNADRVVQLPNPTALANEERFQTRMPTASLAQQLTRIAGVS